MSRRELRLICSPSRGFGCFRYLHSPIPPPSLCNHRALAAPRHCTCRHVRVVLFATGEWNLEPLSLIRSVIVELAALLRRFRTLVGLICVLCSCCIYNNNIGYIFWGCWASSALNVEGYMKGVPVKVPQNISRIVQVLSSTVSVVGCTQNGA